MMEIVEPTDRKKTHIATLNGEVWKPLGHNVRCFVCGEQAYKTCNNKISCTNFQGCGKFLCMDHLNVERSGAKMVDWSCTSTECETSMKLARQK